MKEAFEAYKHICEIGNNDNQLNQKLVSMIDYNLKEIFDSALNGKFKQSY